MDVVCLDLEGVLVPEIWIEFAELTGIEELRATTRDVSDYDALMRQRLGLLDRHRLSLADVQKVVGAMRPLEGAEEFLNQLRERYQVVILSDTYYEFAGPLMRHLGWPTLFCHRLETDDTGRVVGYRIRLTDHKRKAVQSFRALNFKVAAAGDSYNDTGMIEEADAGFFFRAPRHVADAFPHIPMVETYPDLYDAIAAAGKK